MTPEENRPIISYELLKALTDANPKVFEQLKVADLDQGTNSMIQEDIVTFTLETLRILEQRLNALVSQVDGLDGRLGKAESRLEEIAEILYENRRQS
jgi:hypothetical protein